jgi:transcriptional regulator with XRE-family HTH domain
MELHEKVKFYREAKKLSQDSVAYNLGLDQSQYSRRENGTIQFKSDEISKLCETLEISPLELFNSESVIFNNTNQQGGNFGQYISFPEELQKQYELRIKEKDEMINVLKEEISLYKRIHKDTDR